MSSRIVFRADASPTIGGGHVMRCLTLADELKRRGAEVTFVCRRMLAVLRERIISSGHDLVMLPAVEEKRRNEGPPHAHWLDVSWEIDAKQTLEALRRCGGADLLVIDHYALDARWEETLRATAHRVMVIDDLADRPHDCDLLLDQTYGRNPEDYAALVPAHARLLLGTDYALLRTQFARMRHLALERRDYAGPPRRILVSLGASDPHGVTATALRAIAETGIEELRVDLVTGGTEPANVELDALAKAMPQEVVFHRFDADMARLMLEADLAIGAGGTTSWERCCLGLPTLIIITADNQANIARQLAHAGAVVAMGRVNELGKSSLAQRLLDLFAKPHQLREMARRAFSVCDGKGASRAADEIEGATHHV